MMTLDEAIKLLEETAKHLYGHSPIMFVRTHNDRIQEAINIVVAEVKK